MVHHLLAGFKSLYSERSNADLEKARSICGGAGYSSWSGMTEMCRNTTPIPTYEGENTVMMSQSSRFLIKSFKKAQKGTKLTFPFEYLNQGEELLSGKTKIVNKDDFLNADVLEKALAVRSYYVMSRTINAIVASKQSEKAKDNEVFAKAKTVMAQYHLEYLSFKIFRNCINEHQFKDPNVKELYVLMGNIHALHNIVNDSGAIFDAGFFGQGSFTSMQLAMDELVKKLRPQMLPLVESLRWPDEIIPSAIGNSYGDIYETQLQWAKDSRLNKKPIPPYFNELMKPFFDQAKL